MLRHSVLRTGIGLAGVVVAAVLALVGIGLCLWAVYQYLITLWGSITTAAMVGIFMIMIASILTWIVIRLNR